MINFVLRIMLLAAGALATVAPPAGARTDLVELVVETPRDYGYVIGDTITHTVRLELGGSYRLDESALPAARRLDAWLELRAPVLRHRAGRTEVLLTYQLVNAPAATTRLTIPRQTLQIVGAERTLPVFVPEWSFSAAPLVPQAQRGEAARFNLRAERPPPLHSLTPELWRLGVLIGAGVIVLGVLAWAHFGLPWRSRRARPFAHALRRLQRMRGQVWDEGNVRMALGIVHAALDRAAGCTVLPSNAEALFQARPALERVRTRVESFLAGSRAILFESALGDASITLASLISLCRACRDAERAAP